MDRYEFYDKINSYKKNDELKHYGTIGQKWGVRKWQNYDGTFNEAGKERYFGTGKKNNNKEEEKKKWLDRAEEYTNRLQKAKTYKDIDKIENEILKDEHVKPYFDKAKEIYDKTGDWNKAEEYLMKTPIHEEDWIYDMMDSHITNWNQKIGSFKVNFKKSSDNSDLGTRTFYTRDEYNKTLNKLDNKYGDDYYPTMSNDEYRKMYEETPMYGQNKKVGGLFSKKDTSPDVDPIKLKNMGFVPGVDNPVIFTDQKGTYDFGDVKKNYTTNLSRFVSKKDIPIAKKYRDDIEKMFDKFTGLTQEELDEGREMLNKITDEHERKVVEKCLSIMCGSQYTLKPGEGMELRFKGQPGSDKAAENTDADLFTKKNEKGRSETADKMEEAAKKFREDGDKELADETEKTAKEMREATTMSTPERKNMTKAEKRELKNATNRAWKAATKGNWVDWLLFGIIGGAIATTISWFDIKSTAKELGIEGKSKTWSASDWDKIAYVLENGKYAFDQINQK